jgi:hypothetical protein
VVGGACGGSRGGRAAEGEGGVGVSETLEYVYIYSEPSIGPSWAFLNQSGLGLFNRGGLLIRPTSVDRAISRDGFFYNNRIC